MMGILLPIQLLIISRIATKANLKLLFRNTIDCIIFKTLHRLFEYIRRFELSTRD